MIAAHGGPWFEGLFADTPCVVASREVLQERLRAVERLVGRAGTTPVEDTEVVHRLRVGTRRAAAALRLFREHACPTTRKRLAKALRRIRRAAAAAREADVHLARFARDAVTASPSLQSALQNAIGLVQADRVAAQREMQRVAAEAPAAAIRKLRRRLLSPDAVESARRGSARAGRSTSRPPYTLGQLAAAGLPPLLEMVRRAGDENLKDLSNIHQLRIANKKLRYALEILSACLPARFQQEFYPRLQEFQERLGELNDLHDIVRRLEGLAAFADSASVHVPDADQVVGANGAESDVLIRHYHGLRDTAHAGFMDWWSTAEPHRVLDGIANLLQELDAGRQGARQRVAMRRARPTSVDAESGAAPPAPRWGNGVSHRRVAAIDVGTNSIRLTVAETDPIHRFRIIEDVKETTRLGSGVYTIGTLKASAVDRSVDALERMKSLAESYHVDRIRAIGTSALREAGDRREFLDLVKKRAGLSIEIIDAQREARLAFSSVASAFELRDRRVAVADLGGGSTELVLGSDGVVDAIYPLPLGGVRLTDTFGNRNDRGRYRFAEMCRAVDRTLAEVIGIPPFVPDLMIGTGGTFTSLARLAILRGRSSYGGRFPFAVRGYDLPRSEVAELLDWLRRMSADERREVPGISTQRSEIIVAGLCIIDRLMEFLPAEQLRIHDGGIRDGLLAEMIDGLDLQPEPRRRESVDIVTAVRAFAERCGYDARHCEHVARLSLEVFDQLAAQSPDASGTWARDAGRELLEAAALVHDVGLRVDRRQHQFHSYEMIVHASLEGLTRRETEIIANVARYHRRGSPKRCHLNFLKLGDDDQRLVRHLAGILRIADALDRDHTQAVLGVTVRAEPTCNRFEILSGADPSRGVRNAARRADVFERAFHTQVEFLWTPVHLRERASSRRAEVATE